MWRIWILIIKEFQVIWRDKKSRYILFVPPVVQTLLFGFAATMEVKDVAVAVCNLDKGYYGKELVARIGASSSFHDIIRIDRQQELTSAIDSRRVILAVTVPEDFSREVLAGEPVELQVLLDGRRSNTSQIAENYLAEIVRRLQAEISGEGLKIELETRTWFNPNKQYQWFTVPGLIGIIMGIEILLLTGLSVARERELGTFEQLQVSPLSSGEIIIGKTIPALLIGVAEGTLVVLMALFFFKIPLQGSVALLYMSMLLYALAMTGVGLFISALVQTQQQAMLGTFLVLLPIILLSGFVTPVENMPHWLQSATIWNPLRYFLIIVKGVFLKNVSLTVILPEELSLVGVACCTLITSVWFFRRKLA